jgi:hypothetical protein
VLQSVTGAILNSNSGRKASRGKEIAIGVQSPDPTVRLASLSLEKRTLAALLTLSLKDSARIAVYPFGAAEAMLLERCDPQWRQRYRAQLSLGALFAQITSGACRGKSELALLHSSHPSLRASGER